MSKNKCIKCHFFLKAERANNNNENLLQSLSQLERIKVKNKDHSFLITYNNIKQYITCSEWMDGSAWANPTGITAITDAALKKRECPCFYAFLPEYINNTPYVRTQRNDKKAVKANRSDWWQWFIRVIVSKIVTLLLNSSKLLLVLLLLVMVSLFQNIHQ